MVNNPFDLENYTPQVSMRDLAKASRNSYQQTAAVNKRRAQGVEPSIIYSEKWRDSQPRQFVADMPEMPKHDRNEARRRRRAAKKGGKP